MKNKGHFQALNRQFFAKHQRKLLWLLNAPLISILFRKVLRIDCKDKICQIEPNNYKVYLGMYLIKGKLEHKVKVDFRTHNKFSKRLYFAFKPLWWTMHFLDWLILDNYLPRLSFNFATLTVYPDPDPETTSVDGGVDNSGAVWSTVRDAADGNGSQDSGASNHFARTAIFSSVYYITRGFVLFDTSSLTANASISQATLSIVNQYKTSTHSSYLTVVSGSPASNTAIGTADFDQVGTTKFISDVAISGVTLDVYLDMALNASGISNISKTGISKFAFRIGLDFDNTAPTTNNEDGDRLYGRAAETAGTSSDPKLVITYTIAITAKVINNMLLMGV